MRTPWKIGIAAALTVYLVLCLIFWSYTVDDSYIAYRYSTNLAHGQGLVFNPGERVEGYSSLLWVLTLLPCAFARAETIVVASKAGGIVAGAMLLVYCSVWERRRRSGAGVPLVVCALATSLPVVVWSIAGLETLLYTLLLTFGLLSLAQGERLAWAAGSLGLAAVTRPEGILFCVIGAILLRTAGAISGRRRVAFCLLLFVPVALQVLFRRLYYEAWLPNPYYAKMGGGPETWAKGIDYLLDFALAGGPGAVLWLLLPIGLGRLWRRQRRMAVAFTLALAAQTLFMVSAGGDWMKPFRFMVPVLPVLYLLALEGYEGLEERWWRGRSARKRAGRLVLFVVLVGGNLFSWSEVRAYTRTYARGLEETSISLGRWLAEASSPDDWVALGDVGALPYYSGLKVIDLYGLVNPEIAHLAGPALYSKGIDTGKILAREPRYIVLESRSPGEPFEGLKQVDRKIFLEPLFRKEYVLIQKAAFSPSEVTCLFERRATVAK